MNHVINNLLDNIPDDVPAEIFQPLLEGASFRLERIISDGHQSPADFWYDQSWDEWIVLLAGSASLLLEDDEREIELKPWDSMMIPAGCRHRVHQTSRGEKTVWLALHMHKAVD